MLVTVHHSTSITKRRHSTPSTTGVPASAIDSSACGDRDVNCGSPRDAAECSVPLEGAVCLR